MSAAPEPLPHEAEPDELTVQLEVVDQPDSAITTRRMLGSLAIPERPEGPFQVLISRSEDYTIEQAKEFTHLAHTVITSHVQQVNSEHGRPANERVVPPGRVNRLYDDFYNVFHVWPPRVSPERLERLRDDYLKEHVALALRNKRSYPEIYLTDRIEIDLREGASHEAADGLVELLAAFGAAIRPDFVERHMALLRQSENIGR